jgi:hypothetical protein
VQNSGNSFFEKSGLSQLRAFELADDVAVFGYWVTAGFLKRVVWFDFSNEAGVGFGSF